MNTGGLPLITISMEHEGVLNKSDGTSFFFFFSNDFTIYTVQYLIIN